MSANPLISDAAFAPPRAVPLHRWRHAVCFAALAAGLCAPTAAMAGQEAAAAPSAADAAKGGNVFTPDYFTRFAPRTAYDMLSQVPGFTIVVADEKRGLGQASENVLINGQRVTDKSGGAVARLQMTSASDVLRIEVREAASFGIAGLTGQVANVVLDTNGKGGGTFSWAPAVRAHYAEPSWLAGKKRMSRRPELASRMRSMACFRRALMGWSSDWPVASL